MKTLKLDEIFIGDRQRTEALPSGYITELAASIAEFGLLHAPVVWYNPMPARYELIAGECRIKAIRTLASEGTMYRYGGSLISPDSVPVNNIDDMSPADLFELEYIENKLRADLGWKDSIEAIAKLNRLRESENPEHTKSDLGRELHSKMPEDSRPHESTIKKMVQQAVVVEPHLNDPLVAKARSSHEAYQIVLRREHERALAELARRRRKAAAASPDHNIIHGDMIKVIETLDDGRFDLILGDLPYGIDADKVSSTSRISVGHRHEYDDSPENARALYRALLSDGFRVTKNKANLFIFTHPKHFEFLTTYAQQMGWVPWGTPLIWRKSQSEGLSPWGRYGPIKTCEFIFYATKGKRGLREPMLDVLDADKVSRSTRVHAAQKPIDLLIHLIEHATMPGDEVLDPCCGSGSTILAAKECHRHGLGIELDKQTADQALARLEEQINAEEADQET